jgi:hypothetical protein
MADGRKKGRVMFWLSKKFQPFVDITRKFNKPKIKMTRSVRLALLMLRIYLIVMVGILVFKFAITVG